MKNYSTYMLLSLSIAYSAQSNVCEAKGRDNNLAQAAQSLESILADGGWTKTPQMSETYIEPGSIFNANHTLLKKRTDCFTFEPENKAMVGMKVNQAMQNGVRVGALAGQSRGQNTIERKITFDEPVHRQAPLLDFKPTEACKARIQEAQQNGRDTSGWYVITDSLSARIESEQCGRFDVKAGAFVAAVSREQEKCSEMKSGNLPVAVAYKIIPLHQIFSGLAPTTSACEESAQDKANARRDSEMERAIAEAENKATSMWINAESTFRQCLRKPRAERQECIDMMIDFMGAVDINEGRLEAEDLVINTECGPITVPFQGQAQKAYFSHKEEAEQLLASLKTDERQEAKSQMKAILSEDRGLQKCAKEASRKSNETTPTGAIIRLTGYAGGYTEVGRVTIKPAHHPKLSTCLKSRMEAIPFPDFQGSPIQMEYRYRW